MSIFEVCVRHVRRKRGIEHAQRTGKKEGDRLGMRRDTHPHL